MQNEAAQYLDFIDEDELRRRQAQRISFRGRDDTGFDKPEHSRLGQLFTS